MTIGEHCSPYMYNMVLITWYLYADNFFSFFILHKGAMFESIPVKYNSFLT